MVDMGKVFDPENIGMVVCPFCSGKGKLPDDRDNFRVCSQCGGFGMVKKEEIAEEGTIEFRGKRITLPK